MNKKAYIFAAVVVAFPLLLSVVFILSGHPDKNGRVSLTGQQVATANNATNGTEKAADKITESANEVMKSINVKQDSGNAKTTVPQMGSSPYYRVDVSTPEAFARAVMGRGFDEGYGMQCVAGFKQFMFSLSGRIVATKTGGASGYANQVGQIEPLGFTWHQGVTGLQNGDWAIFNGGRYGHVAMRYNGGWLGQNQGAANANVGNAFNLLNFGTSNVIGYYRPNIYQDTHSQATRTAEESNPSNQPTKSNNAPQGGLYVVRRGDTLGQIIINQGVRDSSRPLFGDDGQAQAIANKNNIQNRGLIYPNQIIKF